MSYGHLNSEQLKVLTQYTKGKVVHDLGAGELELARVMRKHGARKVVAIDKEYIPSSTDPHIEIVRVLFRDYADVVGPIDVALLSWPQNNPNSGLLLLIERAHTVIYLGKNTDGSMCGWPGLYWSFMARELLAYVPDRKNVLAVYGKQLDHLRQPTGEELAGVGVYERLYSYDEAEAAAG